MNWQSIITQQENKHRNLCNEIVISNKELLRDELKK